MHCCAITSWYNMPKSIYIETHLAAEEKQCSCYIPFFFSMAYVIYATKRLRLPKITAERQQIKIKNGKN